MRLSGQDYVPLSRLVISDSTHVTVKFQPNSSSDNVFDAIQIQSDSDFFYRWDEVSTDSIAILDDFILPANDIHFFAVPAKLATRQGTIYLHFKQVVKENKKFMRIAKVR